MLSFDDPPALEKSTVEYRVYCGSDLLASIAVKNITPGAYVVHLSAKPSIHYALLLRGVSPDGERSSPFPCRVSPVIKARKYWTYLITDEADSQMMDIEKVNEMWGKERTSADFKNHWLNHPISRAHLLSRISGDPHTNSPGYWQKHFIRKRLKEALSIGCGFGGLERCLISLNAVDHVLGVDVSADAIAGAKAAAQAEGMSDRISYQIADLNTYRAPPASQDAILAQSSVHHIFHLEDAFYNYREALKPGGLFFLDEYIGPSRWQLSDTALEVMNEILAILPECYRLLMQIGPVTPKKRMYRTPISWFEQHDPSESVRSGEIINVLKCYFDIVDFRPYGGGITHLLLSGIAANFDEKNEDHVCILRLILLLEDVLEKHGVITSDFAAIVAKPKMP